MSHGERGAEQFKVDVVDMSSPDRRGDGSTQTTVPTRQLSSNFREQLREYRRENDLCELLFTSLYTFIGCCYDWLYLRLMC